MHGIGSKAAILPLALAVGLCSCSDPRKEEASRDREALVAYVLTGVLAPACPQSAPTLTFAQLGTAGLTAACAKHHIGASPVAGYDASNYASTRSRVAPNDLANSALYAKVLSGSMAANSSTALNESIRDWICSGASP